MANTYVKWPSSDAKKRANSKLFTFLTTVGTIDGSHISIEAPLTQLDSYTNRKSYVAGHLRWKHVFHWHKCRMAGVTACPHISIKCHRSNAGDLTVSRTTTYLGDTAYPFKPYLIVPFRVFSADECHFNTIHWTSRTIIQCAFARVNGKFWRLKYSDMDNLQLVTTVIISACAVNTFILEHDSQQNQLLKSIHCTLFQKAFLHFSVNVIYSLAL